MDETFLKAFSEVVREQVSQKSEVKLKGVGVFKPKHRKQFQQQYEDGRVVMVPPKDLITFAPESSNGYD